MELILDELTNSIDQPHAKVTTNVIRNSRGQQQQVGNNQSQAANQAQAQNNTQQDSQVQGFSSNINWTLITITNTTQPNNLQDNFTTKTENLSDAKYRVEYEPKISIGKTYKDSFKSANLTDKQPKYSKYRIKHINGLVFEKYLSETEYELAKEKSKNICEFKLIQ